MTPLIQSFFDELWDAFSQAAPKTAELKTTLEGMLAGPTLIPGNEVKIKNDHVAFRTFGAGTLSVSSLEPVILSLGYDIQDSYEFPEKRLKAKSYICKDAPKIFVSELDLLRFPKQFQEIILDIAPMGVVYGKDIFYSGRTWNVSFETYRAIKSESEYAAWLLANGMIPNHFTVDCNDIDITVHGIALMVKALGYEWSGEYGSKEALLVQGSTVAEKRLVNFTDKSRYIPSCFYEFAYRYPLPGTNQLFQGFRADNANKIFESTNDDIYE